MASPIRINKRELTRSIEAVIENGARLLYEGYDLEFRPVTATRYYLILIAQEEFAKAFLLYLVRENIAPLNVGTRRALNDHKCKHLVGVIMDYMIMPWVHFEDALSEIERDASLDGRLPNDIGSAIEILCYEKIEEWIGRRGVWAEDPAYDVSVLKIANGHRDRTKQDALYVRLGTNGQLASVPEKAFKFGVSDELERANRYYSFVTSLVDLKAKSVNGHQPRVDRVMAALKLLFSQISEG